MRPALLAAAIFMLAWPVSTGDLRAQEEEEPREEQEEPDTILGPQLGWDLTEGGLLVGIHSDFDHSDRLRFQPQLTANLTAERRSLHVHFEVHHLFSVSDEFGLTLGGGFGWNFRDGGRGDTSAASLVAGAERRIGDIFSSMWKVQWLLPGQGPDAVRTLGSFVILLPPPL